MRLYTGRSVNIRHREYDTPHCIINAVKHLCAIKTWKLHSGNKLVHKYTLNLKYIFVFNLNWSIHHQFQGCQSIQYQSQGSQTFPVSVPRFPDLPVSLPKFPDLSSISWLSGCKGLYSMTCSSKQWSGRVTFINSCAQNDLYLPP